MQPNGANLTGGGTGSDPLSASSPSATVNPYVPFNGHSNSAAVLQSIGVASTIVYGALVAAAGLFATL